MKPNAKSRCRQYRNGNASAYERDYIFRLWFKLVRIREFPFRQDKKKQREQARNQQHGKAEAVTFKRRACRLAEQNGVEKYRTKEGANLVEHFLNAKALAHTFLRCSKRHDGVLGRFLDGFAQSLEYQQDAGGNPAVLTDKGQRRHADDIEHIAENRHAPVLTRLIADAAKYIAQRVADELAQTGNKTNRACRSTDNR